MPCVDVYHHQADGDTFVSLAKQLNDGWTSSAKADALDENLIRQFAYCSAGNICPMQAVIGGITAQEIMKVIEYFMCDEVALIRWTNFLFS